MKSFEALLEQYASLAVEVGIHLQPGEGLIITGNQASLELARLVAKKAYAAGAKHVEYIFNDETISLYRYEHGQASVFESYPKWKADVLEAMYKDNFHHLFISSPNPELLKNVPAALIGKDQKTTSAATAHLMRYRTTSLTKWCIMAVPSPAWAKSVFPTLSEQEAMDALWQNIFDATRASAENPVEAWKAHDTSLKKYKNYLNDARFEKLHFKAPGTDLEVYLAEDHFWMGGSKVSQAGCSYVANIPTEEVFTTPHKLKVNGTLKATKTLNLNGKLVENFCFEFKDGKVVSFEAEKGHDVLETLLQNDEGASYLGEVALVQHNSPISNTGILFNNTLFDENASVHFALGRAYPYAIIDGTQMTEAQLSEKGANQSLIHVDFMVGSQDMSIVAYGFDKKETVLFENGNWVI